MPSLTFLPSAGPAALRRPLPPPVPAREGMAEVGDVRLWYSDTGGDGPVVVLAHPGTGSGQIWAYQRPAFTAAGYRVITYSRRGHLGSEAGPLDRPGCAVEDLDRLLDRLAVARFHAIGSAAGAMVTMDYAMSFPERLLSLVEACTILGVVDESYRALSDGLRPPNFGDLPPEFRELGPSYRAANPEGVRAWLGLERRAVHRRILPPPRNQITFERLRQLPVRTLLLTGDADLFSPPEVLRLFAENMPGSEAVVIPESGHSAYWEQPELFNRTVLDFIGRHR